MQKHTSRIVASILTLAVITLLILAGPAAAFNLNLNAFSDSAPVAGSVISTTASITINSNERQNFPEPAGVYVNGELECEFEVTASETICSEEGVTVKKMSGGDPTYGYGYSYGYGYGYGYSDGTFVYNISLDTDYFPPQTYTVQIKVLPESFTKDAQSNAQSFTVSEKAGQSFAGDDNSDFTGDPNVHEIYFNESSTNGDLVLNESNADDFTVNFASIKNATGAMILPFDANWTFVGETTYSAELPSGTTVDGGDAWDGKLTPIKVIPTTGYTAPSGKTNVVIEMGSNVELNFSQPVKVVIGGMAGKNAAWTRGSGALNEINTVCDSINTAPNNINSAGPRECYVNSGSDLVIWTFHFTEFAAYTPSVTGSGTLTTGSYGPQTVVAPLLTTTPVVTPTTTPTTENNTTPVTPTEETPQGGFLTGRAITDALQKPSVISAILVILLIIIIGYFWFRRPKKSNKSKKK